MENIYNKDNIKDNNIINNHYMFMNGKNIESNEYIYKTISYICEDLISLKNDINKDNIMNISDDEIKTLIHNYYNYIDLYTTKTNDSYNNIYSAFNEQKIKNISKEYIKIYKQDNKTIIETLTNNIFYDDINTIINILNINELKIFEELKYNQDIINIWNNILFIYDNITVREYKIKDILIHADIKAPTRVFGGNDNQLNIFFKVLLIILFIIIIIILIILIVVQIKRYKNINHYNTYVCSTSPLIS